MDEKRVNFIIWFAFAGYAPRCIHYSFPGMAKEGNLCVVEAKRQLMKIY